MDSAYYLKLGLIFFLMGILVIIGIIMFMEF